MFGISINEVVVLIAFVATQYTLQALEDAGIKASFSSNMVTSVIVTVLMRLASDSFVALAVCFIVLSLAQIKVANDIVFARAFTPISSALSIFMFMGIAIGAWPIDINSLALLVLMVITESVFLVRFSKARKATEEESDEPAPRRRKISLKKRKAKKQGNDTSAKEAIAAAIPEERTEEEGKKLEPWLVIAGFGVALVIGILATWGYGEFSLMFPRP